MTNECGWTLQAQFLGTATVSVATWIDARQVCDSGNLGWEGEVREQQMKFKASPHLAGPGSHLRLCLC